MVWNARRLAKNSELSAVIHLDDEDRVEIEEIITEKIEEIITEKIKEALGSGGLISESIKMDERFAYLGKEVYVIKSDIKKLREDLNKLLERDILRALERLKQDTA
jgi:hypothetical protein